MNDRPEFKQLFLEIVGRELEDGERGSIPTLNDVQGDVLEITRAIWKRGRNLPTIAFVRFMVHEIGLNDAVQFVDVVVVGGNDPATWWVCDRLLAPRALSWNVVEASFFSAFDGVEGERWYRHLDPRHLRAGDSNYGVVGVVRRHAKYWRPQAFDNLQTDSCEFVEPSRVLVAHRRWLARQLGARAKDYLDAPGATAEGIIAKVAPNVDLARVTEDASIAAEALIREARLGSPTFARDRGFLGPDAWYGG